MAPQRNRMKGVSARGRTDAFIDLLHRPRIADEATDPTRIVRVFRKWRWRCADIRLRVADGFEKLLGTERFKEEVERPLAHGLDRDGDGPVRRHDTHPAAWGKTQAIGHQRRSVPVRQPEVQHEDVGQQLAEQGQSVGCGLRRNRLQAGIVQNGFVDAAERRGIFDEEDSFMCRSCPSAGSFRAGFPREALKGRFPVARQERRSDPCRHPGPRFKASESSWRRSAPAAPVSAIRMWVSARTRARSNAFTETWTAFKARWRSECISSSRQTAWSDPAMRMSDCNLQPDPEASRALPAAFDAGATLSCSREANNCARGAARVSIAMIGFDCTASAPRSRRCRSSRFVMLEQSARIGGKPGQAAYSERVSSPASLSTSIRITSWFRTARGSGVGPCLVAISTDAPRWLRICTSVRVACAFLEKTSSLAPAMHPGPARSGSLPWLDPSPDGAGSVGTSQVSTFYKARLAPCTLHAFETSRIEAVETIRPARGRTECVF
ncbi:hypothetical protein SAMN04488026_105131 [Aliiruegeria lutimaris]|uniref:Uncharacterized protein n=1 Tax=Aliiruegeria lutimaris TaxID=571298 RepID=A0A1G9EBC6_9RHOB|nr:hypothetical protein SAMN04488026_105131 [Aliiruegeria lutimaris]